MKGSAKSKREIFTKKKKKKVKIIRLQINGNEKLYSTNENDLNSRHVYISFFIYILTFLKPKKGSYGDLSYFTSKILARFHS